MNLRFTRTIPLAFGLVVAATVAIRPQVVEAQYVRPTTLLVPGQLSTEVSSALTTLCADKCAGTRWAGRSFSEGLHPAIAGLKVSGGKGDSVLTSSAEVAGAARALLKSQFLIGSSYAWSLDTLIARRDYSLSVEEARKEIRRAVRGTGTFRPLTNNYLFVLSDSASPSVKEEKGETKVSQTVKVAVFKVAFDSVQAAEASLGDFYCEVNCADRAKKEQQFNAFAPPLRLVATFSVQATGSSKESAKAATVSLANDLVETILDETASAVPAFAVTAKLIAEAPFAARVGTKEGLYRGHRFYAYETRRNDDGTQTERRTAVLYAAKVANNQVATFGGTATKAEVNVADSSTFRKVYPGAAEQGTVIREKPSYISLRFGLSGYQEDVQGSLEIRDEGFLARSGLPVPLGVKAFVALQATPAGQDEYSQQIASWNYAGVGIGYEMYPLRGKLRLMPLIAGYLGKYNDGAEEDNPSENGLGGAIAVGADVGLRITPEIELSGTFRVQGVGKVEDPNFPKELTLNYGPSFGIGLRLQRGLWGIF
ncbi:MAG: hypothetical protein RLZZ63_586 [Gemmatimonadota bacterium]|jgi:hypothetical protein